MPTNPTESRPLPKIVAIVGPTAVGKTAASLQLARQFNGEVVNADSRLFYRGMDIGTAKPTRAEQDMVPHHLIDILHPNEPISLAQFQDAAYETIGNVLDRGHLPFIVGGTPQYVNALLEGWQIPRVEPNNDLRAQLQAEEHASPGVLLSRLQAVDPAAAEKHAGNVRRIIRALEVWLETGRPITEQQSRGPAPYDALEIELWMPRDDLYSRIDARVLMQFESGLVEEVQRLIDAGADPTASSFGSIGYRQVVPHIRGEIQCSDAIERMQNDTHRLVRHQETWWRKNPRLTRIDMREPDAVDQMTTLVERHLA